MTTKEFFHFISEPSKENFLKARNVVINHPQYNPYSNDFEKLSKLMEARKYEEVIAYNGINALLSSRAHLVKRRALMLTLKEEEAESALITAHRILECIELTGDGTKENPYIVTTIMDERDFLEWKREGFAGQALIKENGKSYDLITTDSGKEIYFDITDCFLKAQSKDISELFGEMEDNEVEKPKGEPKKWWKFW